MATTASEIAGQQGVRQFFYLKITGFPYYFFATEDPTPTASYGGDAWAFTSLSADLFAGGGFTAVRALQLPDDQLSQDLKDLVGGIASPERIRLGLMDFETADANGPYKFFGRLFAPGRALTDLNAQIAHLAADLGAGDGTGDPLTVAGGSQTFPASGDLYIGGETLSYSSVSGPTDGLTTFTIDERNKYKCHANYPPTPYYRVQPVAGDDAGAPTINSPVTTIPLTIVGRTAALYVGHFRADGKPCLESEALCRVVGKIQSLEYRDGVFTVEIESVTAELEEARAAPGLAFCNVDGQIILPTAKWRTFVAGLGRRDSNDGTVLIFREFLITVGPTHYDSIEALRAEVDKQLRTTIGGDVNLWTAIRAMSCYVGTLSNGERRVYFKAGLSEDDEDHDRFWYVAHPKTQGQGQTDAELDANPPFESLLYALGFPSSQHRFESEDPFSRGLAITDVYERHYIFGGKPPPAVFIPTIGVPATGMEVTLTGEEHQPGTRFFAAQATNEAAWVRLGDGQILKVVSTDYTSLFLGERNWAQVLVDGRNLTPVSDAFYYVPDGQSGTLEQVLVVPDSSANPLATDADLPARFLASDWDGVQGGTFDVYPEGVGLGLDALMDSDTFRRAITAKTARFAVVDRATTWGQLFTPIARENHAFLIWNPATGKLELVALQIPTAAAAGDYVLDETCRPTPDDTTAAAWDRTQMRTGWEIDYGFDTRGGKATKIAGFTDGWARDAYGISSKVEKIQDKTLTRGADIAPVIAGIIKASVFHRYPWAKYTRKANRLMSLVPLGEIVQVVDATIHNPFTGAFGITEGDNVYGIVTGMRTRLDSWENEVEFMVPPVDSANFRPWAPAALVDRDAADDGWDAGTKTFTLARWYIGDPDVYEIYDGASFRVGDLVLVTTRDNDGSPGYTHADEVAAISTDGRTMTMVTGGYSISSSIDTVIVLQKYADATAARQSGVSWQGNSKTGVIQATTARVNRWHK